MPNAELINAMLNLQQQLYQASRHIQLEGAQPWFFDHTEKAARDARWALGSQEVVKDFHIDADHMSRDLVSMQVVLLELADQVSKANMRKFDIVQEAHERQLLANSNGPHRGLPK